MFAMRWISVIFVVILFIGCAAKEPFSSEVVFQDVSDTVYIPVKYVPEHLTKKVQILEEENHLLRVEIDKLKKENKVLNALLKTSKSIGKLKKQLCDG